MFFPDVSTVLSCLLVKFSAATSVSLALQMNHLFGVLASASPPLISGSSGTAPTPSSWHIGSRELARPELSHQWGVRPTMSVKTVVGSHAEMLPDILGSRQTPRACQMQCSERVATFALPLAAMPDILSLV
jgi:hypothetical protein